MSALRGPTALVAIAAIVVGWGGQPRDLGNLAIRVHLDPRFDAGG